jgi:uncharacterized RDD family membrane protein YckC
MARSRRDAGGPDAEPFLFDLPLDPERERAAPEPPPAPRRERPAPSAPPPELDFRTEARPEARPIAAERPARPMAVPAPPQPARPARRGAMRGRFTAGIADLVVHGALVVMAVAGARLLGARPVVGDWPAFATLLLAFSFLYTVLPLAFWGETLGMSWAHLMSRSRDGEPLTFDQAARRWLGGLLTAATLGLPLFVAGERRSLTDLVSGSGTYPTG